MSQGLITLFVGILVYLWYSRFKHALTWWKRVPTLRDRAFDLAELDLPPGWRPADDLNGSAGIEAVDLLHGRYLIVISDCLDDYDPKPELDAYAASARDSVTSDLRQLIVRGPERRRLGGFDAVQFDVEGVHVGTKLRYLFTVVLGRRAFHQIIAWSPRSAFNRKVFDELLKGFRERPGAAAEPRSEATAPAASAARVIGFRPVGFRTSTTPASTHPSRTDDCPR